MATKLLLVDDENDFLELLAYQLAGENIEIIKAHDGMEALNKARRFLPDVIFLDLMLPNLGGLSVCDILRRQPSTADIPIILVSALGSEMARLNALASGANYYLSKPIKVPELMSCVANAVQWRAARLEAKSRRKRE